MHCLRLIVVETLQRKRLVSESEDIKTIQNETQREKRVGGKEKASPEKISRW